ncbi:MAG: hypothetical protein ACTHMS_16705 [Jatrophihabitans sp.]|uniref:hypothetical protein n=1 Tax=Jatrophihabitans sp. TaxID=1932789 RepID=UPI003F7EBA77
MGDWNPPGHDAPCGSTLARPVVVLRDDSGMVALRDDSGMVAVLFRTDGVH